MGSIRKFATSAGLMAAGGAAVGGAYEGATGGSIGSGMLHGAAAGLGMKIGASGAGRAGRAYQAFGLKRARSAMQSLPRGKAFLETPMAARKNIMSARKGYQNMISSMRGQNIGRTAAMWGGGIGAAGGFAMLPSNRSDKSFAQSSLSDRLSYEEQRRAIQMKYNLQEAMMKKQIWAGA